MTDPFNPYVFQKELSNDLLRIAHNEEYINVGQLTNFVDYFQYKNPQNNMDVLNTFMEDDTFRISLRLLLIYQSLALSLKDKKMYKSAIEVFPVNELSEIHIPTLLNILKHMTENPMSIEPDLVASLPDNYNARIKLLYALIKTQFIL